MDDLASNSKPFQRLINVNAIRANVVTVDYDELADVVRIDTVQGGLIVIHDNALEVFNQIRAGLKTPSEPLNVTFQTGTRTTEVI